MIVRNAANDMELKKQIDSRQATNDMDSFFTKMFKSRQGDEGMVEWTRLQRKNIDIPFTQGIGQGTNHTGNYSTFATQKSGLSKNIYLTFLQEMKLSYLYPNF